MANILLIFAILAIAALSTSYATDIWTRNAGTQIISPTMTNDTVKVKNQFICLADGTNCPVIVNSNGTVKSIGRKDGSILETSYPITTKGNISVNATFLNNKITSTGYNITSGWAAFTNKIISDWVNITNKPTINSVPSGMVAFFITTNCPSGWVKLDGTNGHPNLTNRFIIASGVTYSANATGGASTATLSIANLPAHNHTVDPASFNAVSGYANATHTHSIDPPATATAGHSHVEQYNSATTGALSGWTTIDTSSNTPTVVSTTTNVSKDNVNIAPFNSATESRSHVHTTAIDVPSTVSTNTGSGTAVTILNPYLALIPCVKT